MSEYHLSMKERGTLTDGKWPQWSRKVQAMLKANSTWIYINGPASTQPTPAMELKDLLIINDHIVGALCGIVEDALLQDLERLTMEKVAWLYLKQETHQGGIALKLTALQSAIHTRFSTVTSIIATITDIRDLMTIVYDKGAPTQEEWTTIILLQALTDG